MSASSQLREPTFLWPFLTKPDQFLIVRLDCRICRIKSSLNFDEDSLEDSSIKDSLDDPLHLPSNRISQEAMDSRTIYAHDYRMVNNHFAVIEWTETTSLLLNSSSIQFPKEFWNMITKMTTINDQHVTNAAPMNHSAHRKVPSRNFTMMWWKMLLMTTLACSTTRTYPINQRTSKIHYNLHQTSKPPAILYRSTRNRKILMRTRPIRKFF